jgi:hypothetical protein
MSRQEQLPVNRGFDSSLGYLSGAEDHWDQTRSGYVDFWRDHGPAKVNISMCKRKLLLSYSDLVACPGLHALAFSYTKGEVGKGGDVCQNSTFITDQCKFATYQYNTEAEKIIANHDPTKFSLFLYLVN